MCSSFRNPADQRYARRCQRVTSVSLVGYLVCAHFVMDRPVTPTRILLAGLAGAFFFTLLISSGLLILRKFDEFQRILITRSFLWATVITMGFSVIWGFVELFSRGNVPNLSIIWIPVILITLTAGAKVFIFRQHRSPLDE
jgi:ABC-type enterochelin transport system permease subunit